MRKIILRDPEKIRTTKTKRWLGWLSLCVMVLFGQMSFAQSYCTASGGDTGYENISNVTFGSINNSTTTHAGYNDFTAQSTTVSPGVSYPISVSINADGSDYVYAFIDWNGNGILNDAGEVYTIATSTSSNGPHTLSISVPAGATPGATRMRVMVAWNTSTPTPCGTFSYGEVEDYTVNVQAASNCTGMPNAGTASISPTGGNAGATFSASVTGATAASGLAYQWQKNVGTWQDIAGATTRTSTITSESAPIGTVTNYRLKMTCTPSGQTDYSMPASYTTQLVYCTPLYSSGCEYGARINNVVTTSGVTNISNTGTACGSISAPKGYSDYYNTHQMSVGLGTSFGIDVGVSSYAGGVKVWIDYNQNGTFESNELVTASATTISSGASHYANIDVPTGAMLGDTRMRVRVVEGSTTFDTCASYSYGEAEDYKITILPAPSCLPPSALTTTNLTNTSANLSWTSAGSLFDLQWGVGSFAVGDVATITGVSNNYPLGGLTADTTYSYYVRQDCGSGLSTWSGPYSFFTGYCIPTGTSSSYRINGFSTEGGYTNISNMANGTTSAYNDYTAMSVTQSLGGEITYSVNVNSGVGVKIWIDLNNDLVFDASELVASHLTYVGTTPNIWTGTLTVPTGLSLGDYRVRVRTNYYSYIFESCGEGQYGYGETEDYTLSVVMPPSCMPPAAITSSGLTFTSADLSWTSAGSVFDVEWGVGTFPQGQGDVIYGVTNPYTLNGLTESTSYSYYVRQDCGSEASLWSGPHSFTTPTPGQIGDGTATSTSLPIATCMGYNYSQQIYLASELQAVLEPGSTYITKIRFNQTALPSSGTANYKDWVVYMKNTSMSSFASTTSWETGLTEVFSGQVSNTALGWMEITLNSPYNWDGVSNLVIGVDENTPSYNCTTSWAAFASGSNRGMAYNSDSINPNPASPPTANVSPTANIAQIQFVSTPVPSCLAPADLLASNITSSSAELSWSSTGSMFDIEWGAQGFVQGDGTTISGVSNPYILNGLDSNTSYSFYVLRDCTGETSIWAGPYSFKTMCGSQATVFENFDTYATGSIVPDCWVRLAPATSVGSQTLSSTSPASGTRNIYQYAGTTQNAVIVVLPEFSNINAGTHWLRFKARVGSGAPGTLMVGYVTDISDYSSFTVIENLSITNTTYATDSEYTVAVPASVPANARLAIKNTNDAKSYYWDDVYWEVAPSCLPVTGLANTGITTSAAGISWSAGDSETSWNVSWGTPGYTPEDSNEINSISVSSTSYQITSLAADTAYDVYVRANCGVGDESTWVGPLSIYTGYCQPTTTADSAYIESFTADGGATQSISNLTTGPGLTGTGYSNFSAQTVEVAAGGEINYVVSIESGQTAGLKIWIDWDNNMMFDQPSEVVYTSAGYNASYTGSFTIPANASGTYRMRIGSSYTPSNGPANACTHTGQGEYEDYTISIVSACSAEWTGFVDANWNTAGNWCDNTVPTAGSNVVINNLNPAVINTDVSIASITLGADANLTVNGSLEVGNISVAAGGSLVVANDANLFQSETAVNSGDITVKRNAVIKHLDYTIWSSPVVGQGLQAFSPNTLASRIYDYNTTTDTWQITTGNFIAGKGVMFRAPNLFNDGYYPNAYTYQGTFTGSPHNGDITMNFSSVGTYQGVGNPYPSNMDIEEFWMNNAGTGTLYFWTNTNAWDNNAGAYVANNWATYSNLGGTPAAGSTKTPESIALVGQGFVVEATGLTSVTFNNDMRTAQSGVFFRTAASDKHRLWLNLADASNEVNNILIGYMDGATLGEDLRIDSKMFNYEGSALYSLIDGSQSAYVIQGRSLPFDDFDVVPLGFRATTSGAFTISLSNFDGVFAQGQDIFLKDNLTQTQHNLKDGDYTFVSNQGEFATRFEVVYRASMDVTNPELDSTWVVYAKDKTFFIETQGIDMQQVVVYDMLGRVVYENQAEGNTHSFAKTGANQVLVIKVITTDGQELTKKVAN